MSALRSHDLTADSPVIRESASSSETNSAASDNPKRRTPQELIELLRAFADSTQWLDRVRLRSDRRWYERLFEGPEYDVWLISWMPGQSTGFHDHGASSGAFLVTAGTLEEHDGGHEPKVLSAGQARAFGSGFAHDVRNVSQAPSISIHVYSPPLTKMNEYELEEGQLVPRLSSFEQSEAEENQGRTQERKSKYPPGVLGIDEVLAAARARLHRLSPLEAHQAVAEGKAVLVDIRPESQRKREGCIEGALVVERNVLEWRFDPASDWRLPVATSHDLQAIVFCSEGYTSSLAAAALQELGLWRATDIIGGITSWREEGLPVVSQD
jgi:rhodanese-related sulfurtransferase/mannose-6-phosphate isomerase-like protein (cupin superfamily)